MPHGPTCSNNGEYLPLMPAPEPFVHGFSMTNSDGGQMSGDLVTVPLFGPAVAPEIIENVNWFPAESEDSVVPAFLSENPVPSIWTGANQYLYIQENEGDLDTWAGGYLILQGSGTHQTIITFLGGSGSYGYNGVTLEYNDTAVVPPSGGDTMVLFHFEAAEFPTFNSAEDQAGSLWDANSELFVTGLNESILKFGTASWGVANAAPLRYGFSRQIDVVFDNVDGAPFAIDVWVRVDADTPGASPDNARFFEMFDTSTANVVTLGFELGSLYVESENTGGIVRIEAGIFAVDEFYHVRANYSGGTLRLFVDGVIVDTADIDLSDSVAWGSMTMGQFQSTLDSYLKMDELYVVNNSALNGSDNFTPPTAEWPNP